MTDRLLLQQSVAVSDILQPDGTTLPGIGISGAFSISNQQETIVVTPVIDAVAYTSGDALGGLLTFTGAALPSLTADYGITVDSVVVVDLAKRAIPLDLVLFDRTFTPTANNAPFDPSDADILHCIGFIPIGGYAQFSDNAVASTHGVGLNANLQGEDLFGQLVIRGATTYVVGDIQVTISVRRG